MKRKEHRAFAERHAFAIIIATLFLLCMVVVFACFQYYVKLQETVKAESGGYLQEISKQIGVNASRTIEDNFSILGAVSMVLKNSNVSTFDQLGGIMRNQRQHWDYERVLLVDENGIAYDSSGHTLRLDSNAYLREAIVDRKRSMSTSQMMGSMESVAFALPVEGLTVDGIAISALIATYDLSTFDRILSMTAFDGRGYGHIIRRDGVVVIRSSSPFAPQTGYNILTSLSGAHFIGKIGLEEVLTDIANGQAGQAELIMGNIPLYMSYTPLETQEWCLLTFVPVSVANAKSMLLLNITLLLCALITLVFFILLSVILLTLYRHKRKVEQLAYVDPVTGGNTMQRFYIQAGELLSASNSPQYALIYTNISKFKVLNEQLGRTACDAILMSVSKSIQQNLDHRECMGRMFADNFCVLLKYKDETNLSQRLEAWNQNYNHSFQGSNGAWLPLNVDIGVYVIENSALPLPDMIDRANLALRKTPCGAEGHAHYTIYDERVRYRLLREKQLEDMMEEALFKHEFEVYLQPKYHMGSECIGGAEALARWKSSTEGMIYPDEFIPLFEKNGFVVQLDLYVFEQICQKLRVWLDQGEIPVRISVNCSRVHLKMSNFLNRYRDIADCYAIPPELLEIELTENVLFEDVVHLSKIIEEIHELGFFCSMDDFGSGYSSLNLIRDIPVDVLKLDKVFFRSAEADLARTESVVGSIIAMAHALSMETVAEGVETRLQVDMLRRLGCDCIQGYYFAKPMPISDFEALAFGTMGKMSDQF